ncbi:hypothetical protein TWF481_002430 [Arthrobotrys musiformis]|uniref:F-box domain-containing protein n=1 Tax=Arthrobotrys musiformis TaxID=47236 RepID=A0AAV9VTB1_9PEZI
MSPPAPIDLIPPEISFYILSYLNREDLKHFSNCSKQCRLVAIPLLFRSLTIPSNKVCLGLDSEDGEEQTYTFLETHEQMVASLEDKNSALYLARMDTTHVLLSCRSLKSIGQITKYFISCSKVLAILHNLRSLEIILEFPQEILEEIPDFYDRLFRGLFGHLSVHCPGYTSIVGLAIKVLVGNKRRRALVAEKIHAEGIESTQNRRFLDLDVDSEENGARIATVYPPSLKTFNMKINVSRRRIVLPTSKRRDPLILGYTSASYGLLHCLSLLQCSSATLHTVALNFYPRALKTIYKSKTGRPEIPPNAVFPSVKSITLNVAYLPSFGDRKSPIFTNFASIFPNVEDVNVSYERIYIGEIRDSYYFMYLSGIPGTRRLRIFWPLAEATPAPSASHRLESTDELVRSTRRFVESYGLERLEEVTYVHDDWDACTTSEWCEYTCSYIDTYKAVTCRVVRGLDGEVGVSVGKEFRDPGRMFDCSDELGSLGTCFD